MAAECGAIMVFFVFFWSPDLELSTRATRPRLQDQQIMETGCGRCELGIGRRDLLLFLQMHLIFASKSTNEIRSEIILGFREVILIFGPCFGS